MQIKSVQELVREMENNDINGKTTSSKYVEFSMREDIDKTEAYLNSKHISGDKDYLGREKPFFNIVKAAVNIWYRATDIDRKNIKVRASSQSNIVAAFLATLKLQDWMKREAFGKFLNEWGLSLARHGSSVLKFIEKGNELCCQVMDWNNIIVDAVDFDNNIKIEKLWFTPAQLKKQKNYDQKLVNRLLETETTRKTIGGLQKDNKSGYIPVYEVHGELSRAQYKMAKGEEVLEGDDDEYFHQMHVITFVENKGDGSSGNSYEDYTLFCGRESKSPYMLTHLLEMDGQTYAGGAVKNLFEAQWMVNHSQKQIKDQLDLASKIIFQTADGSLAGQNALVNIENGDILLHADGKPLTQLQNVPNITAMQLFANDWKQNANNINGISEAMQGDNPPSGTAWRQTQALLQESHSLFEAMTENKGLALIDMLTTYIIPYFKKQLNNSDEIALTLEEHQIKQIDLAYLPNEVTRRINQKKKQAILSGHIYDPGVEAADMAAAQAEIQASLKGDQRFIKPSDVGNATWKDVFKDLEWNLDYDITGEAEDVQGAMQTLTTVLQTIATNPLILQDPNMKLVFNKILNYAGGISPLEISTAQSQPAPQIQPPGQPQPQPSAQPQAQPQPA